VPHDLVEERVAVLKNRPPAAPPPSRCRAPRARRRAATPLAVELGSGLD